MKFANLVTLAAATGLAVAPVAVQAATRASDSSIGYTSAVSGHMVGAAGEDGGETGGGLSTTDVVLIGLGLTTLGFGIYELTKSN